MGGEFTAKGVESYCIDNKIAQAYTIPYTPAQNGSAERAIRTLIEMTRAFMAHARAPTSMWPYALKHSAFVLNRLPRRSNPGGVPPLALWTQSQVPSLMSIPVWYAPCWVLARTPTGEFSSKAKMGRFVGHARNGGYMIRMDQSGRFQVSRSVKFDELFTSVPSHEKPKTTLGMEFEIPPTTQ